MNPNDHTPLDPIVRSPQAFRRFQWRILLATMFCYLFYYTGRQTFGFAIPGIEKELGLSKTTLGWISSAMLWSYAIGQAINGNLADKFGGRRMVSLGAVLSCGFNWLVSFGTGRISLGMGWSGNGFVQSMGWAPGSRVLSNWWPHSERGKAFGLYSFAAGMASVVAYVTSNLVLQAGLDWRWIFRLPVLLMLVGGAGYYLVSRDWPSDVGFSDDLEPPTLTPEGEVFDENTIEVSPLEGPHVVIGESSLHRYLAVLSNWRFLLAGLAIGFQNAARYGLLVWVPVYFLGSNWNKSAAGTWITVALPIGMALGAITSGWMSDNLFKSNRSRPIALFLLLAAVTTGAIYFAGQSHPMLGIPLLFLAGFFVYGSQAPFWALVPDLLGKQRAGTGTGVINTFAYVFSGLGEPFIGHTIEAHHNDTSLVFVIVAVACLAGSILAGLVRR